MGRKISLSLFSFLCILAISASPARAACAHTAWCPVNTITLPCCDGVKYVTCSTNPSLPLPAIGDNCCDQPTECPTGTYPYTTGTWDGKDPFCNNEIGYIRTAIGCIHASDPKALINQIVVWTVSVAVGLSLATLLYAGFVMTTAGGDPKRYHEARESITSTFMGLAIIILAAVVMNFFGVRILGMGALGFGV